MYNKLGTNFSLGSFGRKPSWAWGWDLGLNATSVTWISEDEVEVYYDFSNSESFADFESLAGSGFTYNSVDETIEITKGSGHIDCVRWKQPIIASEISSSDVISVSGGSNHLNMYAQLSYSWNGSPWNANPGLAAVCAFGTTAFLLHDGTTRYFSADDIPNVDTTIAFQFIMTDSSLRYIYNDGIEYANSSWSRDISARRRTPAYVAIGAYDTNTIWGNLKITGKVTQ